MLNLIDFNFHGHQGKQLKAYEVHKRSQPHGEKNNKTTPNLLLKKKTVRVLFWTVSRPKYK